MARFDVRNIYMWKFFSVVVVAISNLYVSPVLGAENLILKIGPLERSLSVTDLGKFAQTGEISEGLKPYSPLLTPSIQQLLSRTVKIDPAIGDKFVEELNKSALGKTLLNRIITAIPGSSVEILQSAIALAVRQGNDLSIVKILQAYPQENITIDLTRIAGIALQINPSHLQSQMLNPILDRSLKQEINTASLPSLNPAVADQMSVFQRSLNFNDTRRQRNIPVDIYHSENTQSQIILMSHGFAADRQFLRYLATHLASHGFTVVSVEHPGSNVNVFNDYSSGFDLSELLSPSEFVDRPQDITFVLDQLVQLNQTHPTLAGKLNTENVTMIGHSFGGYTALALAGGELNIEKLREYCNRLGFFGSNPADWLQCVAKNLPDDNPNLKDDRIKQAIALNPIVGNLFGDSGLEKINIPILILASGDDAITPTIPNQLRPFNQLKTEKYLIVALGATHISVADPRYSGDAIRNSNISNEVIGSETEGLKEAIKGVSLSFILKADESHEDYKPFLSADYVQPLSNEKIQLRFTTQIPPSIENWLNGISVTSQSLP
jgi:predicted dienelactone hydrolase